MNPLLNFKLSKISPKTTKMAKNTIKFYTSVSLEGMSEVLSSKDLVFKYQLGQIFFHVI